MASGKAPAWQVREMQRQRVLEEMREKAFAFEADCDHTNFWFDLAIALTWALRGSGPQRATTSATAFVTSVWAMVALFTNIEAERLAIMSKFLTDCVVPAAVAPNLRALMSIEVSDPRKIYGTDRATDEVPLPRD